MTLLRKLIEEDFGLTGNGRWFRSEDHSSLVYDAEKDVFYFNSQEIVGDAYIYLLKIRNYPPRDAKEFLRSTGDFKGIFVSEVSNGEEVITYPKLIDIFHDNLSSASKEYFYKRTITDETIDRFELGYYNSFYTFPIKFKSAFRQFQLRKDDPKTIKNYYRGVGPLLYNGDSLTYTSKIYFVEGLTSCIVLNQNGLPSVSSNGGAEAFQTDWFPYFMKQKEIYLIYDNDPAGLNGAIRTAKILGTDRCKIYTFSDSEQKGYDANDWFKENKNPDDFVKLIETNSKFQFELEGKKDERGFRKKTRYSL